MSSEFTRVHVQSAAQGGRPLKSPLGYQAGRCVGLSLRLLVHELRLAAHSRLQETHLVRIEPLANVDDGLQALVRLAAER